MCEVLRTGWMNTVRNFWCEHSSLAPWFLDMLFASDHPKKGKGHSSCVCGHGIEKVGRDLPTVIKNKMQELL